MRNLIIDDIINNPNTKVTLVLPKKKGKVYEGITTVTAFMTEESFKINGSATYGAVLESSISSMIADKLGGLAGKALKLTEKMTQMQVRHAAETTLSWSGSARPEFTMTLVFISVRREDVRRKVIQFLEGVYPTRKGGGMMGAPWDYSLISKSDGGFTAVGGKFAIQIGTWFRGLNMVLKSVDADLSAQVNQDGRNLFTTINISFSPYRQLYADEIKNFFPKLGNK